MTREMIEHRQAEIADQNDRMVGLFVAVCIGAATGSLLTLAYLLS